MKSTDLIRSFTQPAREELDATQKALNQLAYLQQTYLPELMRRVNGAALLAFPNNEWRTNISTAHFAAKWHKSGAHAELVVYLFVKNLESWSTLTPFFEMVGLDADKWQNHDDAASFTRIYSNTLFKADTEEDFGKVKLQINATLKGETDECKRVIVGYTPASMQEAQPIYQFKCEGDPQ